MDQVTKSSGNVFLDLGCKDPEAMLIKAKMGYKMQKIIEDRGLTHIQAAAIMEISSVKLSKILRGEFREVSEERMREFIRLMV